MPLPIIVPSFIIGFLLFISIYLFINKEVEELAFGILALVLVIALIAYPLCAAEICVNTKTSEIKNFEIQKFKNVCVLIVEDNVYHSKKIEIYNSISKDSKVELQIYYNSFKNPISSVILVDGKRF